MNPDLERREAIIRRLQRTARLMDSRFGIPGTRFRFGLDGLIGLLPGGGDLITALISIWIIVQGAHLGASKGTIARMIGNVAIDTIIGSIPIIGDLFDFAFKANTRNLKLLGIDRDTRSTPIAIP